MNRSPKWLAANRYPQWGKLNQSVPESNTVAARMRYTVQLHSRNFIAKNKKFAVFTAREKIRPDGGGGWAYVVFKGRIPEQSTPDYYLWGDWVHNDRYGSQLMVRTWLQVNPDDAGPQETD